MVKEDEPLNKNKKQEIKTRNASISFNDKDGIIRAIYAPGTEEVLEDAENNLSAVDKISKGQKLPILIIGDHKSMSRDARVFYTTEAPKYVTAVAVLIHSPIQKVIASFLLSLNRKINKNEFQLKFFNSEKEALLWLKKFTK